jgi:hypothetical protein
MPWEHSVPLTTTPEEDDAIEKIIAWRRNEYEHFKPRSWIELLFGMPETLSCVLRVISHLALESNAIILEDAQTQRIETAISCAKKLLAREAQALRRVAPQRPVRNGAGPHSQ